MKTEREKDGKREKIWKERRKMERKTEKHGKRKKMERERALM